LIELADPELQGYGVSARSCTKALIHAQEVNPMILETPLSDAEIGELDAF
jgi:hypothetical protein